LLPERLKSTKIGDRTELTPSKRWTLDKWRKKYARSDNFHYIFPVLVRFFLPQIPL
jgi:hypothetical protein